MLNPRLRGGRSPKPLSDAIARAVWSIPSKPVLAPCSPRRERRAEGRGGLTHPLGGRRCRPTLWRGPAPSTARRRNASWRSAAAISSPQRRVSGLRRDPRPLIDAASTALRRRRIQPLKVASHNAGGRLGQDLSSAGRPDQPAGATPRSAFGTSAGKHTAAIGVLDLHPIPRANARAIGIYC